MDVKWIVGGIVLIVLVAALLMFMGGSPAGTVTVSFMGNTVTLSPVVGQDLTCVGVPPGYTRVYFDHRTDEYGEYWTIGYAKPGNDISAAMEEWNSRFTNCGYTLTDKTSGSVGGISGYSLSYRDVKNNEAGLDLITTKASDGKDYILVRVWLDIYKEAQGEEETGGGSTTESGSQEVYAMTMNDLENLGKEVLTEVFGSAARVGVVSTPTGVGISFEVPREVKESDISSMASALVSRGWTKIMESISGADAGIYFQKGGVQLIVGTTIGTKEVGFIIVTG